MCVCACQTQALHIIKMEGEPNDPEDRDYEESDEEVEDDVGNDNEESSDEERVLDSRLRSRTKKQRSPSPPPPAPQPDVELTPEQVAQNCKELSGCSDFAVVLQFFDLFQKVLEFKEFSPDKLEHALTRAGKVRLLVASTHATPHVHTRPMPMSRILVFGGCTRTHKRTHEHT